jgi:flagellar basal-body rod modification protein FlgD
MTLGVGNATFSASLNSQLTDASTKSGAPSNSAQSPASSTSASKMTSQLATPNLFIKLLMAELEHENPTSPTTPTSILQQTAELSQVEAVTSMTTAMEEERRYAVASDATSLIGKQVTALLTGTSITGPVSQVFLSGTGTPILDINNEAVPLSAVVDVTTVPTTTKGTTPVKTTPATKTKGTTPVKTTPATRTKGATAVKAAPATTAKATASTRPA